MNQRKNSGAAVLLYNLDGSERARKIKFILVRMGVRIKNIKKEDYLKQKYSLGILLGLLFLFFAICISSIGYYRIQQSFHFLNSDFLQGCLLTLMFSYFVIAIITPVGVYFEAQRSQLAMIIVFGGIFLFVALIYFLTKFIGFDLETIIDSLIENHLSITTLATVIFTFICNIISYHISLKLLNKKEY